MYVLVNTKTNRCFGLSYWGKSLYETEKSAKAACAYRNKKCINDNADTRYVVKSLKEYSNVGK